MVNEEENDNDNNFEEEDTCFEEETDDSYDCDCNDIFGIGTQKDINWWS